MKLRYHIIKAADYQLVYGDITARRGLVLTFIDIAREEFALICELHTGEPRGNRKPVTYWHMLRRKGLLTDEETRELMTFIVDQNFCP